jgi:hypothetical protein
MKADGRWQKAEGRKILINANTLGDETLTAFKSLEYITSPLI